MSDRDTMRTRIAEYIKTHPAETHSAIAAKLGCSTSTVYQIAKEYGVKRKPRVTATALDGE